MSNRFEELWKRFRFESIDLAEELRIIDEMLTLYNQLHENFLFQETQFKRLAENCNKLLKENETLKGTNKALQNSIYIYKGDIETLKERNKELIDRWVLQGNNFIEERKENETLQKENETLKKQLQE